MPSLKKEPDGQPHIHIYVRADLAYNRKDPNRYRCAHPDCHHTAARKDLKGKRALCVACWENGKRVPIILGYDNLQLSRPHCEACSNTKAAREKRQFQETLADVLANELGGLSE